MPETTADVLIIGAGASGAAFAWSLARDAHEHPLPRAGRLDGSRRVSRACATDWEVAPARRLRASARTRAGGARTIPSTTAARRSRRRCSTPSAAARSSTRRTSRASTRRDFRCARSTASPTTGRIDYARLEPYYDVNARMMGVSGLAGDPAYPPKEVPLPPVPLGKLGETLARGFNRLGWHWWPSDSAIATQEYEGRAPLHQRRHLPRSAARRAPRRSTDITYWPAAIRRGRRRCKTRCRVREITVGANGMADGVIYYDAEGVERRQKAHVVVRRVQRHRHAAPAAQLALASTSPTASPTAAAWSGKNLMFHPYAMVTGHLRRAARRLQGPDRLLHHEPGVLRDRSRRAASCAATRSRSCAASGPMSTALWGMSAGRAAVGRRSPSRLRRAVRPHRRHGRRSARTCPSRSNRVTLDPELDRLRRHSRRRRSPIA